MTHGDRAIRRSPTADGGGPGGAVVAFAGHMIDAPNRPSPRFPPSAAARVGKAIARELESLGCRAGVSALACGGDLLFADAVMARGAGMHVVLPLNVQAFLQESVEPAQDERWVERFHAVRERRASEHIVGDEYLSGSGTPFQLAALLIDAHALRLARETETAHAALAVWDGLAGDGMGGTASFVGHCVQRGRTVRCIHPMTGEVFTPGPEAVAAAQKHAWRRVGVGAGAMEHRLAAFLFADAKGFSGLRETEMPAFTRVVLGIIRRAIDGAAPPPLVVNTWGDGLFVVTALPREAARVGLRIIDESAKVNWRGEGLGGQATFRVGLHAGPAFVTGSDVVVGRPNAYGREVSNAARIEPVVDPGQVWASEDFMLLAAATGDDGLVFDDLGTRELAKGAGARRLFRVRSG